MSTRTYFFEKLLSPVKPCIYSIDCFFLIKNKIKNKKLLNHYIVSHMKKKDLEKLEKKLNYRFKNKELLQRALTHKTYAFEAKTPIEYNERLEFLGDSILGFAVAEELYRCNKYFSEGELTRRRATLVNNSFLAEKARELGIGDFLFLGKGETKQNGDKNPTNLANALEALIGAVYLDADLKTVNRFIRNNVFDETLKF